MNMAQVSQVLTVVLIGLFSLWLFHRYVYKPAEIQDEKALAHMKWKTTALLQHLNRKYPESPITKNLHARFSFDFMKTMATARQSIGYTLNKKYITICTTNPDGTEGDDDAELLVLVHELCHVATNDSQHTPLFWENFHWLLRIANEELHLFNTPLSDDRNVSLCGQMVNMEDGINN